MRRSWAIFAVFALLVAVLSPQAGYAKGRCDRGSQTAGAVIGGVLGGLLGRAIDGGNDKALGTILGGVAGAIVGSELGKALDKCEQQQVADTTVASLNGAEDAESTEAWESESREGVSGTVTAAPVQTMDDGRVCRSVTRVNYIDGEEMHDNPTFCRTPPSTAWQPA